MKILGHPNGPNAGCLIFTVIQLGQSGGSPVLLALLSDMG